MGKIVTKLFAALFLVVSIASAAVAGEINLSIAASLKDVMNALADTFAKQNVDVKFLKNYGGRARLPSRSRTARRLIFLFPSIWSGWTTCKARS
jgi:ABC-type molybdate transport system substrate-binding protein